MTKSTSKVEITLGTSDAIVLFDWLIRADLDTVPADHKAVKQALADLMNELEQTSIASYSAADLASAQADVSRDMGW
jgi:hypothetical protein